MDACHTISDSWEFQFTHPGKGATIHYSSSLHAKLVSIHAPWEGCDSAQPSSPPHLESFNSRTLGRVRRLWKCLDSASLMFQFTHPGKGATATAEPTQVDQEVSIHAPWEGCDEDHEAHNHSKVHVSIHAPWEGCDPYASLYLRYPSCFNSRTPGGVRQSVRCVV